ncbi:MAG: hypothetical protein ACUVUH_06820 [bacterium]
MKKKINMLLLSFFIMISFIQASNLNELIAISKGDMASIQLNLYAPANWQASLLQYDVYLYSFFDRKDCTIVVELYGMKEKADDAQKVIEHFRGLVKNEFIYFFKNNYAILIDEISEIKFVYRNRSEEGKKEIYLWEKGKYRFPVE